MEKIYRAETAIQNFYKEKQENTEKEAWTKMSENPKYFYSYAKKMSQYKSPVGPLVNEKNEVINEKTCITLNKQYASVFTKPDLKNALPKDYIDSDEDSLAKEMIIEDIDFTEGGHEHKIRGKRTQWSLPPPGPEHHWLLESLPEASVQENVERQGGATDKLNGTDLAIVEAR